MSNKKIEAIAIGGFDGMHAAHQHLFEELGEKGAVVAIETGYADLTPGKHREEHTHYPLFYYELSEIKALSGQEFVEKLTSDFPALKKIVVGYDFHFGHKRSCTCWDLQTFFKGEVKIVDEVKVEGEAVHSRTIRMLLEKGELEKANLLLGYNYKIKGGVVKGQGVGKERLVPTVNIEVLGYHIPKEGVYASLTRLNDELLYPSVSFIGARHITDGSFAIETHILDNEVDAAGKVELSFLHFIRDNRAFDSFETLKEQIHKDIDEARKTVNFLAL
ncbi:MAG: bifunctional riboflavin kinase/FAD synthetase [Campylobacterales bacterium]|nr:bifunctional riboflavin kinase/FAD synthetase [Campylobacterales bacterium]